MNRQQNIGKISQEFHQICNRENANDCIKALGNALTMVLILNFKKEEVRDIVLGLAKEVVKNYNDIYKGEKELKNAAYNRKES